MLSTIDENEYLESLNALFLKKQLDSLNVRPLESEQDFAEVGYQIKKVPLNKRIEKEREQSIIRDYFFIRFKKNPK